jgi:hypothetical protein
MKKIVIVSFLLVSIHFLFAQGTQNQIIQNQTYNSLRDGVSNFDYVYKTAPETPGISGSPYLFDTWSEAVMYLKDQNMEYRVKAIKYDILTNRFEFNYPQEIKVLNGSKVQSFEILNGISGKTEPYSSCDDVIKGEKLTGFCRTLTADGPLKLVVRKSAYLMNPTYNATLMVGNKDKEIIITDEYYLSKGDKSKRIKDKGDIKTFFKDLNFDLGEYKKVGLKDVDKLVELVNHCNQSEKG